MRNAAASMEAAAKQETTEAPNLDQRTPCSPPASASSSNVRLYLGELAIAGRLSDLDRFPDWIAVMGDQALVQIADRESERLGIKFHEFLLRARLKRALLSLGT